MNKKEDNFLIYSRLPTEKINKNTFNIDRIDILSVVKKLNDEDKKIPLAISKKLKEIAKAAQIVSDAFLNGKKTLFIGAGTSGRLGVLEAVELVPTYGVNSNRFIPIIAGGKTAMFKAKEGAEDLYINGKKEIKKIGKEGDILIAIAASGITPYVRGAIDQAKDQKMKVIFITSNTKIETNKADITIAVDVGPEPINGSTRMKSGTATKLVLNMITTSAMVLSGKVYHNWMVDLKPTNYKLILRAQRIFCEITGKDIKTAKKILKETNYDLKTAIVMAVKGISQKEAKKLINDNNGFLKNIIG
ncbi:MAG: N-acetylmuramic acid 6-phosphate etherase [Elusimicrobiota bacterium]